MTIHKLTNPHAFVKECKSKGITYDYLLEAVACMGQQKVCEMFLGKSCRGGVNNISQGTLLNWLATFEFALSNPDVEDNDPYQSKSIEKKDDLFDNYVKIILTPIDEDVYKSWETISLNKLGDEALKYGMTLGVRNSKSIKNLRERMKEMWNRRNRKFWSVNDIQTNETIPIEDEVPNYKMNNILTLRQICKNRGIVFFQKSKNEIIQLLEDYDAQRSIPTQTKIDEMIDYEKLSSRQLKELAKQRGFNTYNNLNNLTLRNMLKEYDEALKKQKEVEEETKSIIPKNQEISNISEFKLVHENGNIHNVIIRDDGYVNGTQLCKANNKLIGDYLRNKQTNEFIDSLSFVMEIPITKLVVINQGGSSKLQGTWVHRKIAYHLAMWVHPPFAVSVSNWLDELLTKGSVKIDKPLLPILKKDDIDLEAEKLESQYDFSLNTNKNVLYLAYIGYGLVKIEYSSNYLNREKKHQSTTETEYNQFRILKTFEISSQLIETTIHNLLSKYRVSYHKQKEIYKPPNTLQEFIQQIENLLKENDLQYQLQKLYDENVQLKAEILQLKNDLLKSENILLQSQINV